MKKKEQYENFWQVHFLDRKSKDITIWLQDIILACIFHLNFFHSRLLKNQAKFQFPRTQERSIEGVFVRAAKESNSKLNVRNEFQ